MPIGKDIRKAIGLRAGRSSLSGLGFAALPLLGLALLAQFASTDQALWASSALYAGLAAAGPRTATFLKVCEVFAASTLCALALVNTGV